MRKRIAVISAKNDAHIPFVQKHLSVPFIIIDPQDIVQGEELSFSLDTIEGVSYDRIILKGVDITDVQGVWYRKPQPIDARSLPVADNFKDYSRTAIERLTMQLLSSFGDAVWISDYYAQQRANNKTLQIRVAQQLEFSVPPTIVTSSKQAAEAFMKKHGTCVSKPLTTTYPKVKGEQKLLLTTLINNDLRPNLTNLHLAPSIFQKAIDVDVEARAIVVGEQIFGAEVRSDLPASKESRERVDSRIRDNRYGHYEGSVHIKALELPISLQKKCIAHCKALGLNFGAIDLIRDTEGVWWFLENNPNGQWAYIEAETGQPIGRAIANLLSLR